MKLTQSAAGYCAKGFSRCCGNCRRYSDNACELVEGYIQPITHVCDHWKTKALSR